MFTPLSGHLRWLSCTRGTKGDGGTKPTCQQWGSVHGEEEEAFQNEFKHIGGGKHGGWGAVHGKPGLEKVPRNEWQESEKRYYP